MMAKKDDKVTEGEYLPKGDGVDEKGMTPSNPASSLGHRWHQRLNDLIGDPSKHAWKNRQTTKKAESISRTTEAVKRAFSDTRSLAMELERCKRIDTEIQQEEAERAANIQRSQADITISQLAQARANREKREEVLALEALEKKDKTQISDTMNERLQSHLKVAAYYNKTKAEIEGGFLGEEPLDEDSKKICLDRLEIEYASYLRDEEERLEGIRTDSEPRDREEGDWEWNRH